MRDNHSALKTLWSDDLGVQSCCGRDKPQGEEVPAHFFSALHWLSPINGLGLGLLLLFIILLLGLGLGLGLG
jgi:hypothetical protein